MQKLKLYWVFYKSTLVLNLGSSVLLSLVLLWNLKKTVKSPPSFVVLYRLCFIFGGLIFSALHKEITKHNDYYFYYNKGITKVTLYFTSTLFNIVFGACALLILHYAALT